MHEAKMLKELNKMEEGFEEKVQWGDVLRCFCGMSQGRIDRAFQELNPSQLSTLRCAIKSAEASVKTRSIQTIKTTAIQLGVSIPELMEYFSSHPSEMRVPKAMNGATRSPNKKPRVLFTDEFGCTQLEAAQWIIKNTEEQAPLKMTAKWLAVNARGTKFETINTQALHKCATAYNKLVEGL